jgi:hypothetical protein
MGDAELVEKCEGRRLLPPRANTEEHVVAHAQVGEERAILHDVAQASRFRRHVDLARPIEEGLSLPDETSRLGSLMAGDALEERRLARSRGT